MVSPQPHDKLHSQLECATSDKNSNVPSQVTINSKDAEKRSISNNDILLIQAFSTTKRCGPSGLAASSGSREITL